MTTDRNDPRLEQIGPDGQQQTHVVLSEEERARGFIRPVRRSYVHTKCGILTTMGQAIAETYAANPLFYGRTYCAGCANYFPVGEDGEFVWADDGGLHPKVGT